MAVLIEGIAVVARRDSISARFAGSWGAFREIAQAMVNCADDELACVHFTSRQETEAFTTSLENLGLIGLKGGTAADFAVVNQWTGPLAPTPWLEFAEVKLPGTNNQVTVCWLFDSPRIAHGLHMKSLSMKIVFPDGWKYDGSLSARERD